MKKIILLILLLFVSIEANAQYDNFYADTITAKVYKGIDTAIARIVGDSLQIKSPYLVKYVSPNFNNSGNYYSTLQAAINSGAINIIMYPGTYTETVKATNLNLFMLEGAVINSPTYYALRCDTLAQVNIKVRGYGKFTGLGGVKMDNSANGSIIDFKAYSTGGKDSLNGLEGFKCQLVGTGTYFNLDLHKAYGFNKATSIDFFNFKQGTYGVDSAYTTAGRYYNGGATADFIFGVFTFTKPTKFVGNSSTVLNFTFSTADGSAPINIVNNNDTGHCMRLNSSKYYGSAVKMNNGTNTVYAGIEVVNNSYLNLNLLDTAYSTGTVLEVDASSVGYVNGGLLINNTNTGSATTVIHYGGGEIRNCVIKNLASTDARCMDLGTGGTKKFSLANSYVEGNSTWALVGVGGNSGNITFKNSLFNNLNTSSYCLKNYSSSYLTIWAYNTNSNVTNYALDSHRFVFPYDSIRVAFPTSGTGGTVDTTVVSTKNFVYNRTTAKADSVLSLLRTRVNAKTDSIAVLTYQRGDTASVLASKNFVNAKFAALPTPIDTGKIIFGADSTYRFVTPTQMAQAIADDTVRVRIYNTDTTFYHFTDSVYHTLNFGGQPIKIVSTETYIDTTYYTVLLDGSAGSFSFFLNDLKNSFYNNRILIFKRIDNDVNADVNIRDEDNEINITDNDGYIKHFAPNESCIYQYDSLNMRLILLANFNPIVPFQTVFVSEKDTIKLGTINALDVIYSGADGDTIYVKDCCWNTALVQPLLTVRAFSSVVVKSAGDLQWGSTGFSYFTVTSGNIKSFKYIPDDTWGEVSTGATINTDPGTRYLGSDSSEYYLGYDDNGKTLICDWGGDKYLHLPDMPVDGFSIEVQFISDGVDQAVYFAVYSDDRINVRGTNYEEYYVIGDFTNFKLKYSQADARYYAVNQSIDANQFLTAETVLGVSELPHLSEVNNWGGKHEFNYGIMLPADNILFGGIYPHKDTVYMGVRPMAYIRTETSDNDSLFFNTTNMSSNATFTCIANQGDSVLNLFNVGSNFIKSGGNVSKIAMPPYSVVNLAFFNGGAYFLSLTYQQTEELVGYGSPEGVVTARIGSKYINKNGGANVTLWIKESGTGNTGWVAK